MKHRTKVWKNVFSGWAARCEDCTWSFPPGHYRYGRVAVFQAAFTHTRLWWAFYFAAERKDYTPALNDAWTRAYE